MAGPPSLETLESELLGASSAPGPPPEAPIEIALLDLLVDEAFDAALDGLIDTTSDVKKKDMAHAFPVIKVG